MIGSKVLAIASGVALLSSLSFAWSISGTVMSETGEGIPDVNIDAFNFAGINSKTDAAGKFSITQEDDASTALNANFNKQMSVHYTGKILSLEGVHAQALNIAVMDALGKVMYKNVFRNVNGNLSIDMSKITGHRASFLRIMGNGANSTYMLTSKGALLKEGDLLPVFMFAKNGYETVTYQMLAEIETDITITLKATGNSQQPNSSAGGWQNPFGPRSSSSEKTNDPASSSDKEEPASSSAKQDVIINCAGKTHQAGDHKMSVNVDGKNRTFIMHVPSAYKGDNAVPLVVDYHPIGGSGDGQLNSSPYKGKTDPEGVITLYPDGTGGKSMMGAGWNVGPCCSNDDDVKFSREMIKQVQEKVCIDTKRVYATGFSMGGGMSNHVACNMSDIYAAVAPAAMDLNVDNSAKCNPTRPISVIMFRGTNDFVCSYDGGDSGFNDGLNFLGAEKNFKFWADKNECTGSPSKNSNGCDEYSNCKDGTKVVLCTKQGGGHDYGDANVGWPFLKSFTMP